MTPSTVTKLFWLLSRSVLGRPFLFDGSSSRSQSRFSYVSPQMSAAAQDPIPSPKAVTVSDVQQLLKKKDEVEAQIKAYYEVLEDVSEGR